MDAAESGSVLPTSKSNLRQKQPYSQLLAPTVRWMRDGLENFIQLSECSQELCPLIAIIFFLI